MQDIFDDSSSSGCSSDDSHRYCWHCNVLFDGFNRHLGTQLCSRCYGDEHYDHLDVIHDDYAPGQVRRWDDDSSHTVALKPVVCVPDEDWDQPWTVEDWVPIRPRKRPRRDQPSSFKPMSDLDKHFSPNRHFRGYTNLRRTTDVVRYLLLGTTLANKTLIMKPSGL